MRQFCTMAEAEEPQHTDTSLKTRDNLVKWLNFFVRFCAILALYTVSCFLVTCSSMPSIWEQIQSTGKIRVVTRDNPATYYQVDQEEQGFEYDLIQAFAKKLGVEAEIYTSPVGQILPDIINQKAHIAAAGLTITPAREQIVKFGPVYQDVEQVVIGRRIRGLPKRYQDLIDYDITVIAESSFVDRLVQVKQSFPELTWKTESELGTINLLEQVKNKDIDLTVIDSNEFAVAQRYYPELARALTLSEPQSIAWAMRFGSPELEAAVNEFFTSVEETGELDELREIHFGFVQAFDFVELVSFTKRTKTRLPEFEHLFKMAGRTYNLDWRFLASIAYQESLWRPNAVSPTGVKGMMMLTKQAAIDMNISDRKDPGQSIAGGTRYFLNMYARLPERIVEPDRTWFALAAYNVGLGHLEDARILTQRAGKNPNLWRDVEEYLPLLEKREYYTTVKHGRARGREPVKYVNNIRDYYDLLKWERRDDNELMNNMDEQVPSSTKSINQSDQNENETLSSFDLLRDIFNFGDEDEQIIGVENQENENSEDDSENMNDKSSEDSSTPAKD